MLNVTRFVNQKYAVHRKHAAHPVLSFHARVIALLLLLTAVVAFSGCTGVAGTQTSSTAQNQNPPAAAAISISPSSIAFGSVALNGTVSQSITVSNKGGSSLTITQASVPAGAFTISGATFPMTVAAGSQSTFSVVFCPTATGGVSGAVSVLSTVSASPSVVSVSGTGVAATTLLNASTSTVNFGTVTTGATGTLAVTLSNAGNSKVTISSVSLAGARFSASGVSGGMILAPGQNATLDVAFSPLAAGALSGTVTVVSNASNSPSVLSLSGTGAAQSVSHSASLSWTGSASTVSGYNVYRSSVSGGPFTKVNSSMVLAAGYTDSTVQAGQTYFYTVTSVASGGVESTDSAEVSANIPTP